MTLQLRPFLWLAFMSELKLRPPKRPMSPISRFFVHMPTEAQGLKPRPPEEIQSHSAGAFELRPPKPEPPKPWPSRKHHA